MAHQKSVLFYDAAAPQAYSGEDYNRAASGIGGTEMTVVRVAETLAKRYKVWVAQRHRTTQIVSHEVTYGGLHMCGEVEPDAIVVLRFAALSRLPTLRRRHPRARLFLWLHDWIFSPPSLTRRMFRPIDQLTAMRILANARVTVIAVSHAHYNNVRAFATSHFPGRLYADSVPVRWIFNPVCVMSSSHRPAVVDPDKLVFSARRSRG